MGAAELSRVQCVPKAQFDPLALTNSYQPLNGTGFVDSIKIMKIWNPSSSVAVDISLDGVQDHDFIPPLGTLIVDFQTNHSDTASYGSGTLNVSQGQILYGKRAAQPTFIQIIGYR